MEGNQTQWGRPSVSADKWNQREVKKGKGTAPHFYEYTPLLSYAEYDEKIIII